MAVLQRLRSWMRRRPVDPERAWRRAQAETRQRIAREERTAHDRGMPHGPGSGGFDAGGGL